MATKRYVRDPSYYTDDGHFDDDLIYDIPAKIKGRENDMALAGRSFTVDEINNTMDGMRRDNQKQLIVAARKQQEQIDQIRINLKPILMTCIILKWLWQHIIAVAISTVAVGAAVGWMTGLIGE